MRADTYNEVLNDIGRRDNATTNLQTSNKSLQPTASHAFQMKLTNNNYIISIGTKNFTERYHRDKAGWVKDQRAQPNVPDDSRAGPESCPACSSRH